MLQNSPTGAVAAAQPAQRLGRPLPRGVEAAAEEVESSEAGRAVLRTLDGGRGWELAIQEFWTCAALSLKILPLTSMPMRCKTWPQLLFSLYAQPAALPPIGPPGPAGPWGPAGPLGPAGQPPPQSLQKA